ncbi:MAG TPA: hypothetical protein VEW46_15080 [Pyrinomonadaceae bacterium]|nr:hypothetical protein [Pyrinomonadaceae bacterium]
MAYRSLGSGAAVEAPQETTRYNYTKQRFEFFRAFADGYYGFIPGGAVYRGNGFFASHAGWDSEPERWSNAPQRGGSFVDCFSRSGLATAAFKDPADGRSMHDASEFWDGAADMLLEINQKEGGASLSLLAVTWMNESSFHMRGLPNTNATSNTNRWSPKPTRQCIQQSTSIF